MRILGRFKSDLVEIISTVQRNHLNSEAPASARVDAESSARLTQFIRQSTEQITKAETADELSQSLRRLIEAQLPPRWLNPFWYFSVEYLLRDRLLNVLNQEAYSITNLLIQSNVEHCILIRELRQALTRRDAELSALTTSPTLAMDYTRELAAYRDRTEIERARGIELVRVANILTEENERLKAKTSILTPLEKLAKEPAFLGLLGGSTTLSAPEKALIKAHFGLVHAEAMPAPAPSF